MTFLSGSVGSTVMRQWSLNMRRRPWCSRWNLATRFAFTTVPLDDVEGVVAHLRVGNLDRLAQLEVEAGT